MAVVSRSKSIRSGARALLVMAALAAPVMVFAAEGDKGAAPEGAPVAPEGAPVAPDGTPNRGAGATGSGDGSGMGQDTTEQGQPRGLTDKPVGRKGPDGVPTTTVPNAPRTCDDGRIPEKGACGN